MMISVEKGIKYCFLIFIFYSTILLTARLHFGEKGSERLQPAILQHEERKAKPNAMKTRTPMTLLAPEEFNLTIPSIGEWKPGFKYKHHCVIRGRHRNAPCCDERERKLHFKFYKKSLNSRNIVGRFLAKVKGKQMTIIGDSLQRVYFMGLAELLELGMLFKRLSVYKRETRNPHSVDATYMQLVCCSYLAVLKFSVLR